MTHFFELLNVAPMKPKSLSRTRRLVVSVRTMLSLIVLPPLVLTAAANDEATRDIAGQIYGAIRSENVERVKSGIAADTNAVNGVAEKSFTMLHFAAEHSSSNGIEILKLLLTNGAKVDAKNIIGQTPLFSAVISDNPEGAKILIAHGAKINVRQDGGWTPLHLAALNGYSDVARVLIKNGATIKAKNSDKKTPLELALKQYESYRSERNAVFIKRYQEMITILREADTNK